jgi:uncharacterized protein involved in outer membrane biogenesis
MQKRKKTPDILSTLMDKPAQDTSKPVSQHTSVPESTEKIKATYYISQTTVDDLEDAWYQLRKEAPSENRGEISKSLIVDTALRIAFEDLKNQGTESQLASKLLHHNTSIT